MKTQPMTSICKYVLKPGSEREMRLLLARHWPTLHRAGLVTDEPPLIFRGLTPPPDKQGQHDVGPDVIVEIFAWKDRSGPEVAHHTPEVMAVWEPMGAICERMEFPSFEALDVALERR